MIKSNLMPPKKVPKEPAQTVKIKTVQPKVNAINKNKVVSKKKSSLGGNLFFMLFLLLAVSIVYLEVFGIPGFLQGKIPIEVVNILGLNEERAATKVLREAGLPKLTARGTQVDDPTIPINGSVEEIVKTMRPDVYFFNKVITDYKEQALSDRIPYQKQAFHIMLSTFYKATPDGIGYLDLAYQAPNFYFVRAIAIDPRTRNSYMDQLRSKVSDIIMSDSATIEDGNVEFSLHGGIQQPSFSNLKKQKLVQPSRINAEILALRTLAIDNQVRLIGLEKPIDEKLGTYRRILLKTTTEADYPSLLNFAEALQKSNIPFGVQQFVSRPLSAEKMQSALEFVLYAAVK